MTLDQILKNEEPQKVEVVNAEPAKVEAKPEDKPAQQRDNAGRFKGEAKPEAEKPKEEPKEAAKPKESATPAPKEAEEPEQVRGLKAAHMAEKTKRQEYERQLLELRNEIAAVRAAQAPQPDAVRDPQGFATHIRAEMETALANERANLSFEMARRAHPDFDEVMAEWPALVAQSPEVYQQAMRQQMPSEWAYQQCKRAQFLRDVGDDPSAYRSRLEQELRQKWEAERTTHAPTPVPSPPPSLASATSAPVREQAWNGPRSLNSILKR